jgi:SulP family sulfate permease
MGFVNVPSLRRIQMLSRRSFIFAMIALFGVLFLGILPGFLLGVALSVLLLLEKLSRPRTAVLARVPGTRAYVNAERHPEAEPEPGVVIIRLDAPLLFINATWMRDAVRDRIAQAAVPPRVVVLDLDVSFALDIKGLDVLTGLAKDLGEQGITLWLANVHADAREMLVKGGVAEVIGESHIYQTIDAAIEDARTAGFIASVA